MLEFECKHCGAVTQVTDEHLMEATKMVNTVCPGLPKKKVRQMILARLKCPICKPAQSSIMVVS